MQPRSHSCWVFSPTSIPAGFSPPFPFLLGFQSRSHSHCPWGFSTHTSLRHRFRVFPAGVRSPCATSPGTVTPWCRGGPLYLPRTPLSSSPCCVCLLPPSAGRCHRGAVSLQTTCPTPIQAQEKEEDTKPCLSKSSCSRRVALVAVCWLSCSCSRLSPLREMGSLCSAVSGGFLSKGWKVVPGYLPVDQQMPTPGWVGRMKTGIFPPTKWCKWDVGEG